MKVALLKLGGTEADLRCEIALILARRLIERAPLLEALFDAFEHDCAKGPAFSAASECPLLVCGKRRHRFEEIGRCPFST